MKTRILILLLIAFTFSIYATESKRIEKSIKVDPEKRIELNGISGMDVKIKSWDNNEIKFDLLVKIKSSDDEYEKNYIDDFKISEWSSGSDLIIDIVETDDEPGWSIFDIVKFNFGNSVDKQIKGEIFVPNKNPIEAKIRYSNIDLKDMISETNIIGRTNNIRLENCSDVRRIDNNYGEVRITNSGGDLNLEARSTQITVSNFAGRVEIDGQYSNMDISNISSDVKIKSRSSNHTYSHIDGNLSINSDYSEIKINDVLGMVEISDRSGTVEIIKAGGLEFDGPYTQLRAARISGVSSDKIKISNRSGLIQLHDAKGNVFIDDQYSNIELKTIAGNVKLDSRSGSIYGENISGNWESTTQYCGIEVNQFGGLSFHADNRSNPIKVDLLNVPESIKIENDYGNVEIRMPRGFNGNAMLEAKYGEVNSDLRLSYSTSGNTVKARSNSPGSGKLIEIKTHSGNITIKEK